MQFVEDFQRSDGGGHTGHHLTGTTKVNKKRSFVDDDDQLFKTRKTKTINSLETKKSVVKLKKKKKRATSAAGDKENAIDGNQEGKVKVVIETLTAARLVEGTILLGCVMEVGVFELRFSITGGLIVVVPITNISTLYTSLIEKFADRDDEEEGEEDVIAKLDTFFHVGDYFPLKIVSKQVSDDFGHTEIIGTLNPSDVNQHLSIVDLPSSSVLVAGVNSVQDYGYEMDVGIEGVKAFLPFKNVEGGKKKLIVAQLCHCSVVSTDERTLTLAYTSDYHSSADDDDFTHPPSISSYLPGTPLKAMVTNVLPYGLEVSLHDEHYRGFVTRHNIDEDVAKSTAHKIGDTVLGHVLYVHPHTKQVCLSLRPMMKKKFIRSLLTSIKIGEIVDKAVVVGHASFGSVLFRINGNHFAIAAKKNLCDAAEQEELKTSDKFALGTTHRARIKKFHLFDNLIELSLKRSVLERQEVSRDDLHIGAIVEGTVKKAKPNGLYIQLGFALNGFLPNMHCTDLGGAVDMKTREALYPLKKKIRVRVTRLDLTSRVPKIGLTAKKTLMKLDQESLFADFVHLSPGMSSAGVVALVNAHGVLLEFFGRVRGFVPLKYLATYKIDQPEKVFRVGQCLRANVVSVDVPNQRMICSLIDLSERQLQKKAASAGLKGSNKRKVDNSKLQLGQVLTNLQVVGKASGGRGFDLCDSKQTIQVFLPTAHLADQADVAKTLAFSLSLGAVLDKVRVWSIDDAQVVTVTMKDSFINPTTTVVISEEDLVLKQSFPAMVRNVTDTGVFFEILGGRCGVIRSRFLQDGFQNKPSELGLQKGSSIEVVAFDLAKHDDDGDEEENVAGDDNFLKKFRFSMKLSDVWDKTDVAKVDLMKKYVHNYHLTLAQVRHKVESYKKRKANQGGDTEDNNTTDHSLEHLITYQVGQVVHYVVTDIVDNCVWLTISPVDAEGERAVRGLALIYCPALGEQLQVAHVGQAVVCQHDWETRSLLVFIQPQPAALVRQVRKAGGGQASIERVKVAQSIKGTVFFVGRHYGLAALAGHAPGLVVTIPVRRHCNDLGGLGKLFTLEESYHFKIEHIDLDREVVIGAFDHGRRSKKDGEDAEDKKKKKKKKKDKNKTPEEIEAKRKERIEKKKAIRAKKKLAKLKEQGEEGEDDEGDDAPEDDKDTGSKRKISESSALEFDWDEPMLSAAKKKKTAAEEEGEDGEAKPLMDLWESDDEQDGEQKRVTVSRDERNEQRRLDEEKLRQREAELSQLDRTPKTLEDFEMSVISSPNSSLVWLKYMAYHLDKGEVDKARQVGERALAGISFREENEKLNVWLGLLNLENSYGDEASMEALVARALKYNDPLTIQLQLASIYDQSGQTEKAEQAYQVAMKKNKPATKRVGIELIEFYMRHQRPEQARQMFRHLLSTLDKRDQVEVITKMGLAEFRAGNVELAKTVFETMLATYWRRLDQWSIYLDALVKHTLSQREGGEQAATTAAASGDSPLLEPTEYIRTIYERLLTFSFPAAKMKFLAKRYLQFEAQFGGKVGTSDRARLARLAERANEVLAEDV